jgi:hypothetical protein
MGKYRCEHTWKNSKSHPPIFGLGFSAASVVRNFELCENLLISEIQPQLKCSRMFRLLFNETTMHQQ